MNFAHYFNNRFAACRLIAETFDQHRDRDVKIYQIPGQVDCVGVSDGIDRWIAPVAPELFQVNIHQLMRDLSDGKDIKLPVRAGRPVKTSRRALLADSDAVAPPMEEEAVLRRPSKSQSTRRKLLS